jgi:alpha-1,6-mannosyltransferase
MGDVVPHLVDATMFWNPSGGVGRYLCAKRRWLASHTNWRHSIASPVADAESTVWLPSSPLPGSHGEYRLPWRRRALARRLRESRPSLIEAADPYRLAWAALDAANALSIPSVAFCHSNLAQLARTASGGTFGRIAEAAARRYARRLYRRFDLVLAPSRAMTDHLVDWGVPHAAHQPLGVDTAFFHPQRRDLDWRRSLGVPESARLLVYVGRFAPEKYLQTLADAVHLLGSAYWLVMLGSGACVPSGNRVIVLPPARGIDAVATALASCDLFVHAGRQEAFGLSVLEAMASGIPVVAQAAEGLAERVDEQVGRGVVGTTALAFAEAIADVFADDWRALARTARRRAESCDWDRVLPQLHLRYRQLLPAGL